MQVNTLKHLLFPTDPLPTSTGKESPASALQVGPAGVRAKAPTAPAVEDKPAASAVVTIRSEAATAANAVEAPAVYSDAPKLAAAQDDAAATDAMARAHQSALERQSGTVTQITFDKQGVLVAKQMPASTAKPPDFVTFAVTAMREFADEAERLKRTPTGAADLSAAAHASKLKAFQSFASRLNIFA